MVESMVDVMMPVYNHAQFIAQAIESVVTQNTNFKFRLIIGEDCSKDNSRAIIAEYAAKYPDIIVPLFYEKNLGATGNSKTILKEVKAKYIALCEGDDYWIDSNKLQKQVDFMESHPDFALCFSDIQVQNDLGKPHFRPDSSERKEVLTIEDFILSDVNLIPSPTLLFRNILPEVLPRFYLEALSGDLAFQLLISDLGKAKYFSEQMAVYRHHSGGLSKSKQNIEKADGALVPLYEGANEYFNYKYDAVIRTRLRKVLKTRLVYGSKDIKGLKRVNHYFKFMPPYLRYAERVTIKDFFYLSTLVLFPSFLSIKKP